MRAVLETTPGGPEVLAVTEVPAPELTPDGVRIRVILEPGGVGIVTGFPF